MPVSLSALEIRFMGIEQEELAIIPFFYRPCNVQCTVQGMRSMFIMYTFCDLHTHSMLLFQEALGKGFIHHAVGRYFHIFSLEAHVLLRGALTLRDTSKSGCEGDYYFQGSK